jgi:hypothetical protein
MKNKLPFILIVVVLLGYVYSNLNQIGFASVDDQWMLLDDPLVQSKTFDLNFIKSLFTEINGLQYAPLNTFYYYVIYQINGYDPYYYHLCSLMIHLLNVVITYMLARRVLEIFQISNASLIGFAVALVWAILPFNVESVVWISASKILLYTLWGNISFLCFAEAYIKSNKLLYAACIITFTLSFLAKEQAVLYALMMGIFAYAYQLKTAQKVKIKNLIVFMLPCMVVALIFGLITVYAAVYGAGSHNVARYPFGQRLVLSFYCLCFYIFNCFIPINLHYHYPFPMEIGSGLPVIYYIFPVVVLALIGFSYKVLKNNSYKEFYMMALGIFITHLLLTIQITPLARASMLADRYMYVSSIGLLLIISVIVNNKFDLTFKKITKSNVIVLACFGIYLLVLSIYSHRLVDNWQHLLL